MRPRISKKRTFDLLPEWPWPMSVFDLEPNTLDIWPVSIHVCYHQGINMNAYQDYIYIYISIWHIYVYIYIYITSIHCCYNLLYILYNYCICLPYLEPHIIPKPFATSDAPPSISPSEALSLAAFSSEVLGSLAAANICPTHAFQQSTAFDPKKGSITRAL